MLLNILKIYIKLLILLLFYLWFNLCNNFRNSFWLKIRDPNNKPDFMKLKPGESIYSNDIKLLLEIRELILKSGIKNEEVKYLI